MELYFVLYAHLHELISHVVHIDMAQRDVLVEPISSF
jgi:hypothetical protein